MNRKRLLLVAFALCAVVCVAVFVFTGDSSREVVKALPDGSTLTLRRVTKGTKHRYAIGNVYQRTADRVLPERWAKKFGAQAVSYNSSNVTHVLWLERNWSTNSRVGMSGPLYAFEPRLTNDAGFDRSYQLVAQLFMPGRYVQAFLLDACPTDCRNIRLTVRHPPFERLPTVAFAFDLPNPDFVTHRKWQAPPCPVESRQDDVSLRLERFTTQAQNPTTARGVPWSELSFVIQDYAVRTNNWFARSVRIFNEAGSEYSPAVYPTDAAGARTYATFQGGLSSAESYKLRFELRHTSYGPQDHRVFATVSVPTSNAPPSKSLRATLQGLTLVSTLSAGGKISARIEPTTSDWRLDLVRAVDDRGRWLQARRSGVSTNDSVFSGTIALEANSAAVDLTFGLTRLRTFEIIARPTLAQ